jgi:hypothetical protein
MLASSKVFLIGSALALAAFPARSAASGNTEEASNVAVAAVTTAVVKCPGVTSIPFTADAEQALPLHIVGSLSCGESVSVISASEGYTAQIRRKDGQEGYVAQIYLADKKSVPTVAKKAVAASAQSVNGVLRWTAGADGCDEFLSHGRHVESITANGVTVQVSLQDTGWKYRVNVAISNQSGENVEVVPGIVTLDELLPNTRSLLAVSPEKLEHTTTHQVLWTLADGVPSRSAVANYASENDRLSNRPAATPDYLNPHVALASAHHVAFERTESVDIESIALKSTSVPAGQITAGVMWFDRDPSTHELSLRVPLGNMVYDFAFSLEEKK